jgi:hypothetical protein
MQGATGQDVQGKVLQFFRVTASPQSNLKLNKLPNNEDTRGSTAAPVSRSQVGVREAVLDSAILDLRK